MDAPGRETTTAEGLLLAGQRQQNGRQKETGFIRLDTGQKREMPRMWRAI
jgi:hypothetical protein